METNDRLLIALGGATGSGKTALAIKLAQKYPQLVILSADSRQVYKKLDVGSAKIGEASVSADLTGDPEPVWIAEGVPQYLIDIAKPNTHFTLTDYQIEAYRLIHACWQKGKIPFLVGGTGLYIQAVVEGYLPEGGENWALRHELEGLTIEALQQRLVDSGGSITPTDKLNKRRVIRAVEKAEAGFDAQTIKKEPITTNAHVFVLERPWPEQRDLAPSMVQERLDLGLMRETGHLLDDGTDREWLRGMGLSYRLALAVLDGTLAESELPTKMIDAFRQLMRRQNTWFKRMNGLHGEAATIESAINKILH